MPIEVEILRYLTQHPEAKDTAEGIARWWLLEQATRSSVAEVRAGLDALVARGRMAAELNADGTIYYYRAKADSSRQRAADHKGGRSFKPTTTDQR